MHSYVLEIPGYAERSTWGYDELTERLSATIVGDGPDAPVPVEIEAVTIDQLLSGIDAATGGRHGLARMVLALSRTGVGGQPRVWLASRLRLVTDRSIVAVAAHSEVPWVAAEARSHPLFERCHSPTDCPACASP
ncbi:hypothetical protein [Leifsonia xyli]|uniref:hypothetical protein n=1 Tax=Leifsonia xyli TaxID=1575 RepID=UPI003D669390